MGRQRFTFTGLKFLGATLTLLPDEMTWRGAPKDAIPFRDFTPAQTDLNKIREWAAQEGMIFEADQLITEETVEEVSKSFEPEDQLAIGVQIIPAASEGFMYLEYPFVPTYTLVKKRIEAEIVYWAMEPDSRRWGPHSDHNGVRFGFWLPGSAVELVSVSYGSIVVQKFENLMRDLANRYSLVALGDAGKTRNEEEITVNGDVKARFFQTGMKHDVQLTVARIPNGKDKSLTD